MGSTPIKNVSYQDLDQVATQAAPATSKTRLYSKTDGALYVVPAGGAETAVSSSIPANLIAYTDGAAPSGWSDLSATYGGRTVVAMPSGGTNGATVLSPLTDAQSPTHTHTGPSHGHDQNMGASSTGTITADDPRIKADSASGSDVRNYSTDGGGGSRTRMQTGVTTSGTGATGATAAHLPYVQLRMIKKS